MAIFGVKLNIDDKSGRFIKETSERIKNPNIGTNPFTGFMKMISTRKGSFLFFYLKPLLPTVSLWFVLFIHLIIAVLTLFRPSLWHSLVIVFWIAYFIQTKEFFYYMMKSSLRRKYDYEGDIKLMTDEELLLGLVQWDKQSY